MYVYIFTFYFSFFIFLFCILLLSEIPQKFFVYLTAKKRCEDMSLVNSFAPLSLSASAPPIRLSASSSSIRLSILATFNLSHLSASKCSQ